MSAYLLPAGHEQARRRLPAGATPVEIPLRSNWAGPSAYIFSLHKAGSTLINGLAQVMCAFNQAGFVSFANAMRAAGLSGETPVAVDPAVYRPEGFIYGGFRAFPGHGLPWLDRAPKVLLLRDPRDILTSFYFSVAFSHRPPGEGPLKQEHDTFQLETKNGRIGTFVKEQAPGLRREIKRYERRLPSSNLAVYHYEDVIGNKAAWIEDLAGFLALDADAAVKRRLLERFDVTPDKERPDRHVRRVEPGDHKEKLPPRVIARLDRVFDGIYEPFAPARRTLKT